MLRAKELTVALLTARAAVQVLKLCCGRQFPPEFLHHAVLKRKLSSLITGADSILHSSCCSFMPAAFHPRPHQAEACPGVGFRSRPGGYMKAASISTLVLLATSPFGGETFYGVNSNTDIYDFTISSLGMCWQREEKAARLERLPSVGVSVISSDSRTANYCLELLFSGNYALD